MDASHELTDLRLNHPIPLWDVAALATRLGVTERFVRRLVHERRIPFYKIGKFVRFDPDGIDAWLTSTQIDVL